MIVDKIFERTEYLPENDELNTSNSSSAQQLTRIQIYTKITTERLFQKLKLKYGQFCCDLKDDQDLDTAFFGCILEKLACDRKYLFDEAARNDTLYKWGQCLYVIIKRRFNNNDKYNYISDGRKYFQDSPSRGKLNNCTKQHTTTTRKFANENDSVKSDSESDDGLNDTPLKGKIFISFCIC
jgi:hypothetical protein